MVMVLVLTTVELIAPHSGTAAVTPVMQHCEEHSLIQPKSGTTAAGLVSRLPQDDKDGRADQIKRDVATGGENMILNPLESVANLPLPLIAEGKG